MEKLRQINATLEANDIGYTINGKGRFEKKSGVGGIYAYADNHFAGVTQNDDIVIGDNNGTKGTGNRNREFGDIFYDLFVPDEMEPQGYFKNMCTPSIMEFAGKNIGNKKGYSRNLIAVGLIQDLNVDAYKDGIPAAYLFDIVNSYFKTDKFLNYKVSISKGEPIMTFFMSGNAVGHAVLIVGFNMFSNTFIYMDPAIGKLQYGASGNFFNKHYNFPLIDNK